MSLTPDGFAHPDRKEGDTESVTEEKRPFYEIDN